MTSDENKKPELSSGRMEFTQDGDSIGGDDLQFCEITVQDAGAGKFFILKTDRWAFDKISDLTDILEQVEKAFNVMESKK